MSKEFEEEVKPCYELTPDDLTANSLWVFFYDEEAYDEQHVRHLSTPAPIPEHYLYICGGRARAPSGVEYSAQFEIEIDGDLTKIRLDCIWHNEDWLELHDRVGGSFPAPPPGYDREQWLKEQNINKRIGLLEKAIGSNIDEILPLSWEISPKIAAAFEIPSGGKYQLTS